MQPAPFVVLSEEIDAFVVASEQNRPSAGLEFRPLTALPDATTVTTAVQSPTTVPPTTTTTGAPDGPSARNDQVTVGLNLVTIDVLLNDRAG